ncbi:MAG TPA: acylphosphatase, partial [Blastocatellia bacterium]|nr:acylphosphatase [Blastocatellia bacterium]
MIARRFVVRGRVQGVGFRYFTLRAARRSGVVGTVRNLPDGN